MRVFNYLFVTLAGLLSLSSCGHSKAPSARVDDKGNLVLNVPSVPDKLTDSLDRSNFRVSHYWDYMDFEIDSLTTSRPFMERSIRDFIRLFPTADSTVVRNSVQSVISRAEVDTTAYSCFLNYPESYLLDSDPTLQEYYAYFADAFIDSRFLDDEYKERPRFLRDIVLMNRVGTAATDFPFQTISGDSALLSSLRGTPVVLYMYNTGCSMCHSEARYLGKSERVNQLVRDHKLVVLAVSKTGPREEWISLTEEMPANWTHGSAVDELSGFDYYAVLHVPTIYLIDAYGNVVLKDVDTTDLILWLDEHELPAVPRPIRIK